MTIAYSNIYTRRRLTQGISNANIYINIILFDITEFFKKNKRFQQEKIAHSLDLFVQTPKAVETDENETTSSKESCNIVTAPSSSRTEEDMPMSAK